MPYNPAGLFNLDPTYRAETGTTIRVEQHNPPLEDIAAALSQVMVRDGRAPMVGDLNMNGFQITGLGPSSAASAPATVGQTNPIGTVIDYAGSTPPIGWLFCDGRAVSRAVYSILFGVIGTTYGSGDGSTTFNIPDARGRVGVGRDDMGGASAGRVTEWDAKVLGSTGGSESVVLVKENLPSYSITGTTSDSGSHTHTGTTNNGGFHTHGGVTDVQGFHSHSGAANYAGDHSHPYTAPGTGGLLAPGGVTTQYGVQGGATGVSGGHTHTLAIDGSGNHSHNLSVYGGGDHSHAFTTGAGGVHSHPVSIPSGGEDTGHSNMQPTIVFNKLIRATYGV